MSGGALLVSSIVAWQAYRSRRLTEATNRAIISVESVRIAKVMRGGAEILVTIENSGKAVAQNTRLTYFAGAVTQLTPEHPDPIPPTVHPEAIEFGNIAPSKKATRPITLSLPVERDLPDWPNLVVVSLKIRYIDEATDNEYVESVSYSAILRGSRTVLPEMLPGPLPSLEAFDQVFNTKKRK
jgi:hypothetical protein